jgi:hypothetical protein
MRDYIEECPEEVRRYTLDFETILYLFDFFDYETERLASTTGMPKHEMWEIRKATSKLLRQRFQQYVEEKVYR